MYAVSLAVLLVMWDVVRVIQVYPKSHAKEIRDKIYVNCHFPGMCIQ